MTESKTTSCVSKVPGLLLIENFISTDEEKTLLAYVNKEKWSCAPGKRRVQQYGYEYNYVSKNSAPKETNKIPAEWNDILKRLGDRGFNPDQVITNEYIPGQGIAAHIDHVKHFGPVVASLTTGSGCVMEFSHKEQVTTTDLPIKVFTVTKNEQVWLAPRSLVVLTGEARYNWTHAIAARKSDVVSGKRVNRGTRVSFTFRTMIHKTDG